MIFLTELSVKLATSGISLSSGTMEVYFQGEYHYMCDDEQYVTDDMAQVICGQLGFTGGRPVQGSADLVRKHPVLPHPLECTGNESKLLECRIDKLVVIKQTECPTERSAGLECQPGKSHLVPISFSFSFLYFSCLFANFFPFF